MLDEIFGKRNFMNEIIWSYKTGGRSTRYYPRKHDNILFYRKSSKVYFDITAVGKPRGAARRNHMKRFVDDQGRVCFSIRSGGKTLLTFIFDSGFMWAVPVPLALCLSRFTGIGIVPLYLICHFADLLKCVVGLYMLKSGTWIKNLTAE